MRIPHKGERIWMKGKLVPVRRVVVYKPYEHNHSPVSNSMFAMRLSTHLGSKWVASWGDPLTEDYFRMPGPFEYFWKMFKNWRNK